MSRTGRIQSESDIYHVTARGVGKQVIFEDDRDRRKFGKTMRDRLDECNVELYAWCFMQNHVHLLPRFKSFDLPANVSVEYDTFDQDAATADIALTYHVDDKEKNYLDYSITVSFVYDLDKNTISNDRMVAYITPKTK